MSGFSVRLTHKVMAIGIVGLIGLLAFGAIYQIGSWSQEASRAVANKRAGNFRSQQAAFDRNAGGPPQREEFSAAPQ